jgi:hypothetical protein
MVNSRAMRISSWHPLASRVIGSLNGGRLVGADGGQLAGVVVNRGGTLDIASGKMRDHGKSSLAADKAISSLW